MSEFAEALAARIQKRFGASIDACRVAGGERPCSKILDCWIGRLPVVEFLKNNYSAEVLEQVFAPQPGRIQRILDIAEKVDKSSNP